MSKFIKLTPHMDVNCSIHLFDGDGTRVCEPVNLIKGPESMFSYDDARTTVCMVNSDKINRVYVGKVQTEGSPRREWSWLSPIRTYSNIDNYHEMLHTIVELDNGQLFSVIEKPEYVSYLLAGLNSRNWPTNAARYWTFERDASDNGIVDEKMISEFKPIPDLIRSGLE
tara:strand:+ start:2111 stop:2617 length:507 start_codon:yes stop_codon:yes gene_type:complete